MPGLRLSQAYQMVHLVQMEIRLGLMEGQEVRISDFGSYKVHDLKPRRHKLPNGEWATTTTAATVKFKPAVTFVKELGDLRRENLGRVPHVAAAATRRGRVHGPSAVAVGQKAKVSKTGRKK